MLQAFAVRIFLSISLDLEKGWSRQVLDLLKRVGGQRRRPRAQSKLLPQK